MFLILRVPSTDAPQRQRKRQHIGQPAQPNGVVRQQPGAARRGADGRLFGRETTLRRATLSTAAQVIYAHTHTHTPLCHVVSKYGPIHSVVGDAARLLSPFLTLCCPRNDMAWLVYTTPQNWRGLLICQQSSDLIQYWNKFSSTHRRNQDEQHTPPSHTKSSCAVRVLETSDSSSPYFHPADYTGTVGSDSCALSSLMKLFFVPPFFFLSFFIWVFINVVVFCVCLFFIFFIF